MNISNDINFLNPYTMNLGNTRRTKDINTDILVTANDIIAANPTAPEAKIPVKLDAVINVYANRAIALLFVFGISFSGHAVEIPPGFTSSEKRMLRKCRGNALAFYHKREIKEYTRLMNLARTNPSLLKKYVGIMYGNDALDNLPLSRIEFIHKRNRGKTGILRPSFGLHLGSFYHAAFSSISGNVGHQNFEMRLVASLNLNTLLPEVTSGENCQYGFRKGIEIFSSLANSPDHLSNMLDPSFVRTGSSRKRHTKYRYNTVTMFTGPKVIDFIFHPKESKEANR